MTYVHDRYIIVYEYNTAPRRDAHSAWHSNDLFGRSRDRGEGGGGTKRIPSAASSTFGCCERARGGHNPFVRNETRVVIYTNLNARPLTTHCRNNDDRDDNKDNIITRIYYTCIHTRNVPAAQQHTCAGTPPSVFRLSRAFVYIISCYIGTDFTI